jgi:hypothetical protein
MPSAVCLYIHHVYEYRCKQRETREVGKPIRLFEAINQKDRYYSIITDQIDIHIPRNLDLGAGRGELGTHSVRKCADTYAVNMPCGPGQTVVKLRAGHSLGKVQDCYQKEDASGDCFCGRVLTGIPMTTADFASLPPHFDEEGLLYIRENIGFDSIFNKYDQYPPSCQRAVPYLLASVLYQYKMGTLCGLLPDGHPIYTLSIFNIFKHHLPYICEHIHTGINM